MLKISKLADYATILMDYFAKHPGCTYSAALLAEATHIPLAAVSKVLKLLSRADLLTSERGANGGYQLARQAEDISIANIVAAIDGQVALTACSDLEKHCKFDASCQLRGNWQLINRVVLQALHNISLAQMGKPLHQHEIPLTFQQMVKRRKTAHE